LGRLNHVNSHYTGSSICPGDSEIFGGDFGSAIGDFLGILIRKSTEFSPQGVCL
jgi:hypothetical protein